jgi:hypothetical protein
MVRSTTRLSGVLPFVLMLVASLDLAAQSGAARGTQRLRYADKSWTLLIDLPGFVQVEEWASRNGTRRMFRARDYETGVVVSAFLERNPELGSHAQCREHYWAKAQRSPIERSDVTRRSSASMEIVRWMQQESEGRPVRWQNVHAYLFKDSVCVEVHLSKVLYEPDDERLFDAVLRTVRFADTR